MAHLLPFASLPASRVEHPGGDAIRDRGPVGDGHELNGKNEPAFRMPPSDQRFRADELAVDQVDLRLVEQFELVTLDRAFKLRFEPQPSLELIPDAMLEHDVAV